MSRVWGREFERLAALSAAHEPPVVVGGEKVFVVAVLDLVEIELRLASNGRRVRKRVLGGGGERKTYESETINFGVGRVKVWLLVRSFAGGRRDRGGHLLDNPKSVV